MKWGQTIVTVAAVAAAHEVGRSDVDAGDVVELTEIDGPPRPLLGIIGARRCSQLSIDSGRRRRYVPAQLTGGFAECQVLCTAHVLETRSADPFTKYLTICRKTVVRYLVNSGPLIWYTLWSALTLLVELMLNQQCQSIRLSIRPAKIEQWGVGGGYLFGVGCRLFAYDQLMPLPSSNPIISCLI